MKIVMVNPTKLTVSAYNPRKMSAHEMTKLRRSIREFGVIEPIVVQMPGSRIIGGHQRVEAAIAEGLQEIPIIRLRITDAKAKLLNLALNKISGEWDEDKLRSLLAELHLDTEDLDLTGFDSDEIEKLLSETLQTAAIEKVDLRPAPEVVWYLLGIPLSRFADVQEHVAALESDAEISVQSSRDKLPEGKKTS